LAAQALSHQRPETHNLPISISASDCWATYHLQTVVYIYVSGFQGLNDSTRLSLVFSHL
jgi:hypothetical protein